MLALEHGKAIFPAHCPGVDQAEEMKAVILEDAYLLRPIFHEHVLVEYDPVKAVRLKIRRLNRAGKSYKKPPSKRLNKDDYHAVVDFLRQTIYAHPAIEAGMYDVIERRWGVPHERSRFVRTLPGTIRMAETLFGRKKPWRRKLKLILIERKDTILRALGHQKLDTAERAGVDWLLGEMKAMRLPGIKAWLKRTGYQSGNTEAA